MIRIIWKLPDEVTGAFALVWFRHRCSSPLPAFVREVCPRYWCYTLQLPPFLHVLSSTQHFSLWNLHPANLIVIPTLSSENSVPDTDAVHFNCFLCYTFSPLPVNLSKLTSSQLDCYADAFLREFCPRHRRRTLQLLSMLHFLSSSSQSI